MSTDIHKTSSNDISSVWKDIDRASPVIPDGFVNELMQRRYGMHVLETKELDSYVDRNIHVIVDQNITNKFVSDFHHHGYILKILETDTDLVEATLDVMKYVRHKGIPVQECVQDVNGRFWTTESVVDKHNDNILGPYVIFVLKYVIAEVLITMPYVPVTFYNLGKAVGRITNSLKGYENKYVRNRVNVWSLQEIPRLKDLLFVIKDEAKLNLVTSVLQAIDVDVLPYLGRLRKAYVHGDLNDQNILVKEIPGQDHVPSEKRASDITCFIDFFHATYSYLVYDIAIVIAYLSIECKLVDPLDVGGHVLAGYLTERTITKEEFQVLNLCICGRLCQTLVIGAYCYYKNPSNEYILTTSKRGWDVLRKYCSTTNENIIDKWNHIMDEYKTNNVPVI